MVHPNDTLNDPSFAGGDDIDQFTLPDTSLNNDQLWNNTEVFDQSFDQNTHGDVNFSNNDAFNFGFNALSNDLPSALSNGDSLGFGSYGCNTDGTGLNGWFSGINSTPGIPHDPSARTVQMSRTNDNCIDPNLTLIQPSSAGNVPSDMQQFQQSQRVQQSPVANYALGNLQVQQSPFSNENQLTRVLEHQGDPEQSEHASEHEHQNDYEDEIPEGHQPVQSIGSAHSVIDAPRPSGSKQPAATTESTPNRNEEFQRVLTMAQFSNMSQEQKKQAVRALPPNILEGIVNKHKYNKKMLANTAANPGYGTTSDMIPQPHQGLMNANVDSQPVGNRLLGPSAPTSQGYNALSRGSIMRTPKTLQGAQRIINKNALQSDYISNEDQVGMFDDGAASAYPSTAYSGQSDTSQSGSSFITQSGFSNGSQAGYSSAPTSMTSSSRITKMPSQVASSNGTNSGSNNGSRAGNTKASRSKRSKATPSIGSSSHVSKTPSQSSAIMQTAPNPTTIQSMPPPTGGGYQHLNMFQLARGAVAQDTDATMTEANYVPTNDDFTPPSPTAPRPAYDGYAAFFRSSAAATAHRKSTRVPPKKMAPDVERVIRYGRPYWVRRIYDSMIDVSDIADSASSIHRSRFEGPAKLKRPFSQQDLEATAHHIFDTAISVHTVGWTRVKVYHKHAARGKLVDRGEESLEIRLNEICKCLKRSKASVDDALRGGVTLALLCDNAGARLSTKNSNNAGNANRGKRLETGKKLTAKLTKQEARLKKQEEELKKLAQSEGRQEVEQEDEQEAE